MGVMRDEVPRGLYYIKRRGINVQLEEFLRLTAEAEKLSREHPADYHLREDYRRIVDRRGKVARQGVRKRRGSNGKERGRYDN